MSTFQCARSFGDLLHRLTSLRCLAVVVLVYSPLAFSNAEILQEVPLPSNVTAEYVALDVVQHGHRMSMANLIDAYPVESVIEFYRQAWAEPVDEGLPGFIEEKQDNWHLISRLENGHNTVVQLRTDSNGSEAYLSVMELEPVADYSYKPAMPRNGVLVSATSSEEFGKPTQTDVIFSKSRQGVVAGFYRGHFSQENWKIVSDTEVKGSTVMFMERSGAQAEVVVTPALNGSVTVVNKVGRYD